MCYRNVFILKHPKKKKLGATIEIEYMTLKKKGCKTLIAQMLAPPPHQVKVNMLIAKKKKNPLPSVNV